MPKFDFDHINPRTGLPEVKKRIENDINLMSRMPSRSCWIKMLQNRVNLNSVGNLRYVREVWFDIRTKRVSENRLGSDAINFREYTLPNRQIPAGWIELNKIK